MCVYILYCVTLSISKLGKPHCNQEEMQSNCTKGKMMKPKNATIALVRCYRIQERYAVSTMHTKNNGLASTTFPLNWLKDIRDIYRYK